MATFRPLVASGASFRGWGPAAPPPIAEVPPPPEPEPVAAGPTPQELEALLEEARARGAAEARAALEAELAELRQAVDAIGPALEQLDGLRRRTLAGAAGDVADIVRLFARRVIGDALAMNPDALRHLVEDALDQLPEGEEVQIAVPAGAETRVAKALGPALTGRVVGDPDLSGGAVLKTRNASLDATLETALNGLDAALRDWLAEQREER
jgi:flagellar biosynthesis/type III secretory pathway protein FliH